MVLKKYNKTRKLKKQNKLTKIKTKQNKLKKQNKSTKQNNLKIKKNKKNKTKKYLRGGSKFISNLFIKGENYNITMYNILPENVKQSALNMCSSMYEDLDDENTADLVKEIFDDATNEIYILSNNGEVASFIIIKHNYCEHDCSNCDVNCAYILLTCTKKEKRGQGIFKKFLNEIAIYLKQNNINCIRLTAINQNVYNIYSKIGFSTEIEGDFTCNYKMIKNI